MFLSSPVFIQRSIAITAVLCLLVGAIPPAAATTDEAAMDDATTTATASDSDAGVPGFTPVTAVVALLGGAFAALRRT